MKRDLIFLITGLLFLTATILRIFEDYTSIITIVLTGISSLIFIGYFIYLKIRKKTI